MIEPLAPATFTALRIEAIDVLEDLFDKYHADFGDGCFLLMELLAQRVAFAFNPNGPATIEDAKRETLNFISERIDVWMTSKPKDS